jgi:hypothetical protein
MYTMQNKKKKYKKNMKKMKRKKKTITRNKHSKTYLKSNMTIKSIGSALYKK